MKIEEVIKQKKFQSPIQKAMINLLYTSNWASDQHVQLLSQYDLTHQQFNVLRILRGKSPDAITMGEIKEVMIDKNPDLTRLCDRLISKKLIERELNASNRRQVIVKITKLGLKLLKELDPKIEKRSKKINLSNQEAEMLSSLLDKLRG